MINNINDCMYRIINGSDFLQRLTSSDIYYQEYIERPILEIKSYEYHYRDQHIFVNPNDKSLRFIYDNKRHHIESLSVNNIKSYIKERHHVHIFMSWCTVDDIELISNLMVYSFYVTNRRIIIHIPKSIDDVSLKYIKKSIAELDHACGSKSYRLYIERDNLITSFNFGDRAINIRSIYSHRYSVEFNKKGE